ncbi:MAG: MotA/TolQ/ExbB proton channel family protein [Bacteroidales bacterium]|jgi:biopolymer transport protein ExbB|nr:MotA/TolQ/ExbB proton channel family protein [Bacteroidales bacterium]
MKTLNFKSIFSALVVPLAIVAGFCIFFIMFGDGSHFQGGSNKNQPLPGDYMGVVYKGGYIVPILMSLLLISLTFTIERFFALSKAKGKGATVRFVQHIKDCLTRGEINEAIAACDRQKGSVANVVNQCMHKYSEIEGDTSLSKEQKLVYLQQSVEEATALEMPALGQNLPMLATLTSLGTLIGLLGTVLGMISAFSALAHAGAPDSVALANGISEALINTALGIGTAAVSMIFYNVFTVQIDKISASIDEMGYSIVQTFSATHK